MNGKKNNPILNPSPLPNVSARFEIALTHITKKAIENPIDNIFPNDPKYSKPVISVGTNAQIGLISILEKNNALTTDEIHPIVMTAGIGVLLKIISAIIINIGEKIV